MKNFSFPRSDEVVSQPERKEKTDEWAQVLCAIGVAAAAAGPGGGAT